MYPACASLPVPSGVPAAQENGVSSLRQPPSERPPEVSAAENSDGRLAGVCVRGHSTRLLGVILRKVAINTSFVKYAKGVWFSISFSFFLLSSAQ